MVWGLGVGIDERVAASSDDRGSNDHCTVH
jgi:hypothetical protein